MYSRYEDNGQYNTGLLSTGETNEQILSLYPDIEQEDIFSALAYATWRSEEYDVQLKAS